MKNLHSAERRRRTLANRDRAFEVIARRGRRYNFVEHGVAMAWGTLEKGAWFCDLTRPRHDASAAPWSLFIRYRAEIVFRSVSEGDRMRARTYVPGSWENILLAGADQSEGG